MQVKISIPEVKTGGFFEGKSILAELNQNDLGTNPLWVFDASTPNFDLHRPSEILMGVWALFVYGKKNNIFTDYPILEGIGERQKLFQELINLLKLDLLNEINVIDFLSVCANVHIHRIQSRGDRALGSFFCQKCNKEHLIRRMDKGKIRATGTNLTPECIFSKELLPDTRVSRLTQIIGFKPFLNTIVTIVSKVFKEGNLIVRDYSNSRGIVRDMIKKYGSRTLVSTRVHIKKKDGSDPTSEEFFAEVAKDPSAIKRLFEEVPFLSDGRVVNITV